MSQSITGIHHVTAIACEAQKNVQFYVGILGLHEFRRSKW
jgi:glyoxalase family protein